MKKKFIYILITVLCFFSFNIGVKADYNVVCEYDGDSVNNVKYSLEIHHYTKKTYGHTKDYEAILSYKLNSDAETGSFKENMFNFDAFTYKKNSKFNIKNITVAEFVTPGNVYSFADINNNSCPKYVSISPKASGGHHICFDNNGSDCVNAQKEKNIKVGEFSVILSGSKHVVDNTSIPNGQTCTLHLDSENSGTRKGFCYITLNKVSDSQVDISVAWNDEKPTTISSDSFNSFPCGSNGFLTLTLDNKSAGFLGTVDEDILIKSRKNFDEQLIKEWDKKSDKTDCNGLIYPALEKINGFSGGKTILLLPAAHNELKTNGGGSGLENDIDDINSLEDLKSWNYEWPDWYNTTYDNCEDLIGENLVEKINDILLYIRILVPILLIGLGVSDFIKAMISVEESAMKKAQNKFLKRLIIAAVIFLIPSLVNLLFNLINGVWAHINNSACNIWN